MDKIKTYDLPTRIFHWLFAPLFVTAFLIAKYMDDDSPYYTYHMLIGLGLGFIVSLRIIWGITGSKYARFSSFKLNPKELIGYFISLLGSKTKRYLGHNPASSYAALAMFAFTFGLGTTGILMSLKINKAFFEEVHELLAHGFLIVAVAHVVGVVFHQLKHKDGMTLSMINGKKEVVSGEVGISSNHAGVAALFLALIAAFILMVSKNYNKSAHRLDLFGFSLQLGEDETEDGVSYENSKDDYKKESLKSHTDEDEDDMNDDDQD